MVVAPGVLLLIQLFAGSNPPSIVVLLPILVMGKVIVYVPIPILMIALLHCASASALAKLAGDACVPVPVPVVVAYITEQLCVGGGLFRLTVTENGALGQPAESYAMTVYVVLDVGDILGDGQVVQVRPAAGLQR